MAMLEIGLLYIESIKSNHDEQLWKKYNLYYSQIGNSMLSKWAMLWLCCVSRNHSIFSLTMLQKRQGSVKFQTQRTQDSRQRFGIYQSVSIFWVSRSYLAGLADVAQISSDDTCQICTGLKKIQQVNRRTLQNEIKVSGPGVMYTTCGDNYI